MRAEARSYHRRWPVEVCTFSSTSRGGLIERLEGFKSFLRSGPPAALKDVAYTLNVVENAAEVGVCAYRLAFVASTLAEAAERTTSALERVSQDHCKRIDDPRGIYFFESPPVAEGGRLAFLFPGEGSQYAGMLSDLCLRFPQVRGWFDRMDRAFTDHARGCIPSQFIFPLPSRQTEDQQNRLWQTDGAVEAVFTASQAISTLLAALHIRPDAVVGHSAGDYSALFASGAFCAESEVQFVQQARELNSVYEELSARGGIPRGVLLVVSSADPMVAAEVIAQSDGALHLALDNCPHQVILCGTEEATSRASNALRSAGAVCDVLPFARAYHTPMFEPVSVCLSELLQNMNVRAPSVPVYSCVTGKLYPAYPEEIRRIAAAQWSRPVRFRETIDEMYQAGVRVFVEVGPRNNLTAFVNDILRGRSFVAVPSDIPGRANMVQIQHLVAQLFACGAPMRLDEFYVRRGSVRIPLESKAQTKALNSDVQVKLSLRLPVLQPLAGRFGAKADGAATSRALLDAPAQADRAAFQTAARNPDSRELVLERFLQNTSRALDLEREVMTEFLASRSRGKDAPSGDGLRASQNTLSLPANQVNLPFVRHIVSLVPGREVKVECEIDLSEDLFLRHHTLGGRISNTDEHLVGLPVIPLTVTMEILAEVASLLAPHRIVVGMRDILVSRWLIVEHERLVLEIKAQCGGPGEVQVELRSQPLNGTSSRRESSPAAVATVIFAQRYPRSPGIDPLAFPHAGSSKWRAGEMYTGTGMFHGPLFQVVFSMDRTSREGGQATFIGPASSGFFRTRTGHQLTDPVTLDGMGQVVGYWIGDQFETGLSVFPFRLAKLDLYRAALQAGEKAECRLRIVSLDEQWIRSDIQVIAGDNELCARMTGWEDRRLDLPRRFYDFRISPVDVLLSNSWAAPIQMLPQPNNFRCTALEPLPTEVFEAHGEIWLLVLAYMVLNEAERHLWHGLKGKRRTEWLFGRIAAKDAVRLLLREIIGLQLCPADIQIAPRPSGGLEVKGRWIPQVSNVPVVSISHAAGLTIAVAGFGPEYSAVGADIERLGRINGQVEPFVLSDDEQNFLATLPEVARAEWATRLWCAKEAVGKALGVGVLGLPLHLHRVQVDAGRVDICVSDLVVSTEQQPRPAIVTAYTGAEGEHAFGTALV